MTAKNQSDGTRMQIQAASETANRQILATVVTSARLQWIDALRDDVSLYLAVVQRQTLLGPAGDSRIAPDTHQERSRLRNRIELRLDPLKEAHNELLKSLDDVVRTSADQEVRQRTKEIIEAEWKRAREEVRGASSLSSPMHNVDLKV